MIKMRGIVIVSWRTTCQASKKVFVQMRHKGGPPAGTEIVLNDVNRGDKLCYTDQWLSKVFRVEVGGACTEEMHNKG